MDEEEFIRGIIAAAVINKSHVVERAGLYCLGPFARRVSFASQQIRALNLVWALRRSGRVKPGNRIAVVGAGLAGVTASAALLGMGCRVRLFEQKNGLLPRQRHTSHRIVHPSINQWPRVPVDPTTKVPFLDWYGSECGVIVATIQKQWDLFAPADVLQSGIKVTGIDDDMLGGQMLTTFPPIKELRERSFDAVILTIGFGHEKGIRGFNLVDYWDNDNFEVLRTNTPDVNFIVSGCGDGGLIDALRLVHFNFRKGELILKAALSLTGSPIADRIGQAESAPDRSGEVLQHEYIGCVKTLFDDLRYQTIAEELDSSLVAGKCTVRLLDGRNSTAFRATTAPIHKFLIAHAMVRNTVVFHQADAARHDVDGKILVKGQTFAPSTPVIVRHGAEADFGNLLHEDELDDLRRRQTDAVSELHASPRWPPGAYEVPTVCPVQDFQSMDFLRSRKPFAKEALSTLSSDAGLLMEGNQWFAVYSTADAPILPDNLFGIPLRPRQMPEVVGA